MLAIKAVVLSSVDVFSPVAVGVAENVALVGAQVAGRLVGWLLGGWMRRYFGGGPGRLRRLVLGQLWRAHSDLDRGLVDRSQVFLGATAHVTIRERTPPPHVTGHWRDGRTQLTH